MSYVWWAMSCSAQRHIKTSSWLCDSRRAFECWYEEALRDRSWEFENLLCFYINLRWANNKKGTISWVSNLSRFLSAITSIPRHTVHHFYEGQVTTAVRTRHGRKWVMTPCLLRDIHSQKDHWFSSYSYPPKPAGHRAGAIYSVLG